VEGRGCFGCFIDSFVSQYAHVRGDPDERIETLLLAGEDSWTRIRETRKWDQLVSEMADRAVRESDTMSAGWCSNWRLERMCSK